jgi:hypothetical protein
LERFEGGRAERERAEHERAEHADVVSFLARAWRDAPARAGGDSPAILGETDPLVRSPLKPKPYLRSGAIALPEPGPDPEPEPEPEPEPPDLARYSATSPDTGLPRNCDNRTQRDVVRRNPAAWHAEGQGFESP